MTFGVDDDDVAMTTKRIFVFVFEQFIRLRLFNWKRIEKSVFLSSSKNNSVKLIFFLSCFIYRIRFNALRTNVRGLS